MEHVERLRPAQLSYLAIFCPRLGTTEETFRDQAVFYYSRKTKSKRRHSPNHERIISNEDDHLQQENDNEKLRQIGLAQAIVDFAQNFSAGKPVESVETDKTRTVIHQLEQDWWLVAVRLLSTQARVRKSHLTQESAVHRSDTDSAG